MKKIFTLFTALLVVIVAGADTININTKTTDALRVALNSANDGDVIVMAAGTYVESNNGYLEFKKNLTIMAQPGKSVTVQPRVTARISGGKKVQIIGVTFDAQDLQTSATWYEHIIYANDASDGNILVLENCEFKNFHYHHYTYNTETSSYDDDGLYGNSAIYCAADKKLDSCIINNCYFHDITGGCLSFKNTGMIGLVVSNSTFANIDKTNNYYSGTIAASTTSGSVNINFSTFYECKTIDASHNVIELLTSSSSIFNSIFMEAEGFNCCASKIPTGGNIKNCLTYNFTNWQGAGAHYGHVVNGDDYSPTLTNCATGDPLFVSAASANFTLGSTSPALNAATDGSNLGDPRWWPTYKRTGVANDTWGTICLPTAVSSLPSDVKFYKVNGKRMSGETPTAIVLDEVASLEAGKPYIFHVIADMSDFTLTCASSATTASAASINGLIGTDVMQSVANGKYIIYNGEVCKVNGATVTCGAHRAYFDLATMEETTVPAGSPGIREIPMAPEITTSMADVESEEKAIKFFQNGQLYILRDGVTYDAVGRIIR